MREKQFDTLIAQSASDPAMSGVDLNMYINSNGKISNVPEVGTSDLLKELAKTRAELAELKRMVVGKNKSEKKRRYVEEGGDLEKSPIR